MRLNLRDGLWYDFGESGNIPSDLGYGQPACGGPTTRLRNGQPLEPDATDEPPPKPSNLSLRLNGTAGSYARTSDSPYLDYQYSLTLMAVVAVDDWTPAARQILVSKWGVAGQRSYYWALDPDGIALVLSRDGTASIEHKLIYNFGLANAEPAAIGVSFTSDLTTLQDEVRFWRYDPQTLWNQIGDTKILANPSYLAMHNSTTEVQVGAHSGNVGNVPGLFRLVSIRVGVGEDNTFGGTEMALMRGDLPGNPTYDRYGNVWSNQGTWSYQPMTNPPLMSQVVMIAVEGVLAADADIRRAPPTKWAKQLYDGIRTQYRTIALTRANEELARWWLNREGLAGWSGVLCNNGVLEHNDWKADQVREFLANGWEIGFYLDTDRETVAMVQGLGVLTLCVGMPVHPPGWRADDTQFRPWTDVVDTLDPRP